MRTPIHSTKNSPKPGDDKTEIGMYYCDTDTLLLCCALFSGDSSAVPPGGGGGGGSGYLGSSLLGRTVMIVGILSVISHGVYTFCLDDISVEVLIIIPSNAKISK